MEAYRKVLEKGEHFVFKEKAEQQEILGLFRFGWQILQIIRRR